MKLSASVRTLVAAVALTAGGSVFAAACSVGGRAVVGGASTDDATLSLAGASMESSACHVSTLGNGGNTNGTLLAGAFGGDPFVRIAKLGESNGSFLGVDFTLTATGAASGSTAGTWTLAWTGGPANLDLVLAIHASNRSGSFLFDDVPLLANSGSTGTWRIEWPNNGGQVPGFSNMTVWARQGAGDVPGPNPASVPVPATALLIGAGLFGVALRRRKH